MAIIKIDPPTPTAPTSSADWQRILDYIDALSMVSTGIPIWQEGSVITRGTVFRLGGVLFKATSDTNITGSYSGVVRITATGSSASADFVNTLSGVSWDSLQNGYYDNSGRLYVFDEVLAIRTGSLSYTSKIRLNHKSTFGFDMRNYGNVYIYQDPLVPTNIFESNVFSRFADDVEFLSEVNIPNGINPTNAVNKSQLDSVLSSIEIKSVSFSSIGNGANVGSMSIGELRFVSTTGVNHKTPIAGSSFYILSYTASGLLSQNIGANLTFGNVVSDSAFLIYRAA